MLELKRSVLFPRLAYFLESSFFLKFGTDHSFFLKFGTDHSSPRGEFTTDKDDPPTEHDGFGGGESIGASGGAKRLVQGALLHAFSQHTQDLAYVAEHTKDLAYVTDWR